MMKISLKIAAAASILTIAATGAFAQTGYNKADNGTVNPPPPYPSPAQEKGTPRAQNPYTPGATGTTVVPGSNSTIAGDSQATYDDKTRSSSMGESGGGSAQ